MRRSAAVIVRRVLLVAIVTALAAAAATPLLLPPRPLAAPSPPAWRPAWPVVRGAYHVHSQASDGTGTRDEIAGAAARAGLQFVILTDHGNGTRAAAPPAYLSGVLCIDAVEISTDQGHYVALGLAPTPFPLGGAVREVIADVRRFGGFGIAAHPGSPKPALRWSDWDAPFDGLEWLNADSEWRDESLPALLRGLLTYPWRPVETLAALLDRPRPVIDEWERRLQARRVPALAAADAHARLGFGQTRDPYDDGVYVTLPDYEVSFAAFSNHVVLDRPLSGDAAADAMSVLGGIVNGRVFTVIDGVAALGAFELRGASGATVVQPGEYLDPEGAVVVEAQIAAPPGTTLTLLRDGQSIYETQDSSLRVDVGTAPAAYRVEARAPGRGERAAPWLFTNPIYVGLRERHEPAPASGAAPAGERTGIATSAWRAEASDGSRSTLASSALADGTPALEWRFAIAGDGGREPYAAMRFPVGDDFPRQRRLQLRAQSDRPRRIWIQLRAPGNGGERWGASIYLDDSLQAYDVRFEDFRPLGPTTSPQPALDRVDSLLLVVDTLHTPRGSEGEIWIPDLWLVR